MDIVDKEGLKVGTDVGTDVGTWCRRWDTAIKKVKFIFRVQGSGSIKRVAHRLSHPFINRYIIYLSPMFIETKDFICMECQHEFPAEMLQDAPREAFLAVIRAISCPKCGAGYKKITLKLPGTYAARVVGGKFEAGPLADATGTP